MKEKQESKGTPASAAASAAQKLEKLFKTLDEKEKYVITELVRASLLQAAEHFEAGGGATHATVPDFVTGITGQHAPSLVKSLRFPGTLAAHSIPGCNSRALEELRTLSSGGKSI